MKSVSIVVSTRTAITAGVLALALVVAGVMVFTHSSGGSHNSAGKSPSDTSWKPASARLLTRYTTGVTPDHVRTEYPRPQFARTNWQSLNGLWQFGFDENNTGETQGWQSGKEFAERILVPFPFEAPLSGIGRDSEVHEHVWYRRNFDVPSGWNGKRVLLNFGAVFWETTVYVNGKRIGQHRGGYTPFSFDITDALKPGGPQELVVQVFNPSEKNPAGWQPRGKLRGTNGIWYTRTTGIWQPVWLEPVATAHIVSATLTPTLKPDSSGSLAITANVVGGGTLTVRLIQPGGTALATAKATVQDSGSATPAPANLNLDLPRVLPWSPESPSLYNVQLRLEKNGGATDEVTSYTAFRAIGIDHGRLTLNNKPYFYRGVLDQGFWPDGIYTPPSDEAIKNDVEMARKFGFNMARKHVKVEDPRWYYWCDRLGLAVWQDMPSAITLESPVAKENFRQEWSDIVATLQSEPCIVQWIPFNEDWGHPEAFQDEIVTLTRRLDPSRPLTDASGWKQRGLTDVLDAHNYSDNLTREGVDRPDKPKVVGEYGGVGFNVPGHIWANGTTYIQAKDPNQFLAIVNRRTAQLYRAHNLSGFVYTQLTDVEQEMNGLLTYDREPKADSARIARVITGKEGENAHDWSVLTQWRLLGPFDGGIHPANTQPSDIWHMLDVQPVPNEAQLNPWAHPTETVGGRTLTWQSAEGEMLNFWNVLSGDPKQFAIVYAVTEVDSPQTVKNVALNVGSDDGVQVWLNGKQIHRNAVMRGLEYYNDRITGLTLQKGKNIFVFKVVNGVSDWQLAAALEGR